MRLVRLLVLPVVFLPWLLGCRILPKTYDDCVLEHLGPGMDGTVAGLIVNSCEAKYPARDLTAAQLANLIGRSDQTRDDPSSDRSGTLDFSGFLYNGTDLALKQIWIQVTATSADREETRVYRVTVTIQPQEVGHFAFKVVGGQTGVVYFSKITRAKGYSVG